MENDQRLSVPSNPATKTLTPSVRWSRWLTSLVRVAVGAVMLLSGAAKYALPSVGENFTLMLGLAGFPFVSVLAVVVPAAEMIMGVALLFGRHTRLSALGVIATMLPALYVHFAVDGSVLPRGLPPHAVPVLTLLGAAFLIRRGPGSRANDGRQQGEALTVRKVEVDQKLEPRDLVSIKSERVPLPNPDLLVHLQFRRFAGCPICNLHLHSIVGRHREIEAAQIREVVVFHSPVSALLPYQHELPFSVIADPARKLYREFGVETSSRALLDPRAWGAVLRGVFKRWSFPSKGEGIVGLPADFLIASDGRVLARKYGVHASDQWSVDDLLRLASSSVARPRPSPS